MKHLILLCLLLPAIAFAQDKVPIYLGGDSAVVAFLQANFKFPDSTAQQLPKGIVDFEIHVLKTGQIDSVKTSKQLGSAAHQELIRVFKLMTWQPALEAGVAVDRWVLIPIRIYPLEKKFEILEQLEVFQADEIVFTDPQFPGGEMAMHQYFLNHLNYPQEAMENGEAGTVYISFIIDTTGQVIDAKIVKQVSPSIDAEALRLVNQMPKWTPATKDGKPVRILQHIPVTFRLH